MRVGGGCVPDHSAQIGRKRRGAVTRSGVSDVELAVVDSPAEDRPGELRSVNVRVAVVRVTVDYVVAATFALIGWIRVVPSEKRLQIDVAGEPVASQAAIRAGRVIVAERLVAARPVDGWVAWPQGEGITQIAGRAVAGAAGLARLRPDMLAVPGGPGIPARRNRLTAVDQQDVAGITRILVVVGRLVPEAAVGLLDVAGGHNGVELAFEGRTGAGG